MPKLTNHPTKRENNCIALNQAISRRKLNNMASSHFTECLCVPEMVFLCLQSLCTTFSMVSRGQGATCSRWYHVASFLPLALCLPPLAVGSDGVALNQHEKVIL